jgi:tripartite-type tricarboxylate transporter receptor subunit TctC
MRASRLLTFAVILCGLVAFVSATAPSPAQTPDWPQRPVRFIVPFGPGAGADITARLLADKLSAKWGQPVVVENRPGGDAFIAITAVINAHDDHVLLFASVSAFTAHPYLHDKLPYQISDLVPIARVTNTLIGVGVPTSLDVATLKEFVTKVRAEPSKLNYASVTGANDLLFVGFLKTEELDMAKVPYKDPVHAINDLAEGRIHAFISAYAILRPQVQSGKVKVLALTNRKRAPSLPDIPTADEVGFKSLNFDGLSGLLGPRGMPLQLRERIAADIRGIVADPAFAARLTATGQVVNPGTPEEFAASIDDQRATVMKIGKMLGIQPAQ